MDDEELKKCRYYLRLLARKKLWRKYRSKVDSSDIVQGTLLRVTRVWERFQQLGEGPREAYLRAALADEIRDMKRRYEGPKRDVDREQSFQPIGVQSSVPPEPALAEQTTPSQEAMRDEQLLRLAEVIARLPEDQQTAVELHYFHEMKLGEIARTMGKTDDTVSGLLRRGLKELKRVLGKGREAQP